MCVGCVWVGVWCGVRVSGCVVGGRGGGGGVNDLVFSFILIGHTDSDSQAIADAIGSVPLYVTQ